MSDNIDWDFLVKKLPRAIKHKKATYKLKECYYEKNGELVDLYDKEGNILCSFGKKAFYEFKSKLKPNECQY